MEFDKSSEATMGGPMGIKAGLTGGHLCIDLTNIEMSGDDQQKLLRAVQATVVAHLARQSAMSKVVTISMSPNNGQEDRIPIGLLIPIRIPGLSRLPGPSRLLSRLRLRDPDSRT